MIFLITKSIQQTELKRGSVTFKNHFPFPWGEGGKLTADFPVA